MKNDKISKLESLAREGFLSENNFIPPKGWQNEVIADIHRRKPAEKQAQSLFQTRLVWRFAVASFAVAALICITLYLTLPDNGANDYQANEVSFDNFDNYIELIAQL